jgi:hypothetical protein
VAVGAVHQEASVAHKPFPLAGWILGLLLVFGGAVPLRSQEFERPPDGYRTPTIIPAGPTQLEVKAVIPARLDLLWPTVANAAFYRITRSSSLQPAEIVVNEIPSEPPDRTAFYLDRLPERSGSVKFSYRVNAIFVNTDGSRTVSTSSPVGTATALMPVAPPKFKTRVTVSQLMGRLRVIVDWGAVANATGYYVFQVNRTGVTPLPLAPTTVKQTTMTIDNVTPGQGGTVCAVTVYDEFYRDDSARSCDLVLTR